MTTIVLKNDWCASGGCEELSWYAEDDSPLPTDIE